MPERACQFCAIVRGEEPAEVVLDTAEVVAFLDRRPVFKGHLLVVPREHVDTLTDLPDHLLGPVFASARLLAAAVTTALGSTGSFVAMNNTVSQSVPHLHVHVVPRTKGDGLRGFFWPRTTYAEGEMVAYADRLRAVLGPGPTPDASSAPGAGGIPGADGTPGGGGRRG